jgi:hypothetical protein
VIDDSSWTRAQGEERGIVPHALVGRTMDTVAAKVCAFLHLGDPNRSTVILR